MFWMSVKTLKCIAIDNIIESYSHLMDISFLIIEHLVPDDASGQAKFHFRIEKSSKWIA